MRKGKGEDAATSRPLPSCRTASCCFSLPHEELALARGWRVQPGSRNFHLRNRAEHVPAGRARPPATAGGCDSKPAAVQLRSDRDSNASGYRVARWLPADRSRVASFHQSFADRPVRMDPCVVEYAYVTADENGDDQIIASGETEEGTEPPTLAPP